MNVIPLDALRLGEVGRGPPPRAGRSRRIPPGVRFLRGPIPMPWLERALALKGAALAVGILLWFRAGLTKSPVVALSMTGFKKFGISRWSAQRGLLALETAGLVRCTRAPGRNPRVEILDASAGALSGEAP